MKRKAYLEIITALLVLLFVYAAFSKLLTYASFRDQLQTHPYIKQFAGFIAMALPVAELGIAALLALPATRLTGLYCTTILLIIFTIYLICMLMSGEHLPCSCGGVISLLSWRQHVLFNMAFIGLSFVALREYRHMRFWSKSKA